VPDIMTLSRPSPVTLCTGSLWDLVVLSREKKQLHDVVKRSLHACPPLRCAVEARSRRRAAGPGFADIMHVHRIIYCVLKLCEFDKWIIQVFHIIFEFGQAQGCLVMTSSRDADVRGLHRHPLLRRIKNSDAKSYRFFSGGAWDEGSSRTNRVSSLCNGSYPTAASGMKFEVAIQSLTGLINTM